MVFQSKLLFYHFSKIQIFWGFTLSIVVVVDQFSKYSVFMAAPKTCPPEEIANLFFSHVVKRFSLPKDIVSD